MSIPNDMSHPLTCVFISIIRLFREIPSLELSTRNVVWKSSNDLLNCSKAELFFTTFLTTYSSRFLKGDGPVNFVCIHQFLILPVCKLHCLILLQRYFLRHKIGYRKDHFSHRHKCYFDLTLPCQHQIAGIFLP